MQLSFNKVLHTVALVISLANVGFAENVESVEKNLTMICRLSENEEDRKDFTFDFQFEGFSNHGKRSIEKQKCLY